MKKFSEMYLEELRHDRQWRSVKPSVKAGDLVLLVKKDVAQGHWQLAVVEDAYPLLVCTVVVKTKADKYKKPITQLTHVKINCFKD
jgi:hypothetical protein